MSEGVSITRLPNGITVATENIPYVQSFSLGFWLPAGSVNEQKKTNGISHFIEHMLFKGTNKRSAKKISEDIESVGGYINAFTGKENTCYYGRGTKENIAVTFDVLADMVQDPLFRAGDIEKEAGVIIDEMNDIEDSPDDIIFDRFEENIFKGSTLAYPIIGSKETVESFTPEILRAYHKKHYGIHKMMVTASGAVDHAMIVELCAGLGGTKKTGGPENVNHSYEDASNRTFVYKKEIQQVHCIMGKPLFGNSDPRRTTLSVLSTALGEGSSSRLFQTVREKTGIAYQIHSFVNLYRNASSFGVYFSTGEKQYKKALHLVNGEIEKLVQKGIAGKELKRVKEYLKGSMVIGLESTTNRMMRIANDLFYFNRVIPVEERIREINAVSADEVNHLAQTVFQPETMTQIIIGSQQ